MVDYHRVYDFLLRYEYHIFMYLIKHHQAKRSQLQDTIMYLAFKLFDFFFSIYYGSLIKGNIKLAINECMPIASNNKDNDNTIYNN